MNVRGKTILITGGAGGLGGAMAQLLSQHGASILILDLEAAREKGEALAGELTAAGGAAWFCGADVTLEEDWQKAVALALEKTGRVDVLVNNAGINIRKPVEEMSVDEWMTMMRVNTASTFLGCKYAIPVMRAQGGGAIINTSSVCGLIGHRYTTEAYTATKGAVTMLTKAIASRYAKDNIRCNSIHPSTVDTPFIQALFNDPVQGAQRRAERLGEVPLGRLATSDDVAYAVLYLASEEASFINGVALPIDGGVTCC
ncbi:MAG TPA: glucose 1-dehydrogenase [Candidatus Limnocylindria bacterium]|nr:glucose 1-dehydrogenase [Candidatus Limnocylindria bacterium]